MTDPFSIFKKEHRVLPNKKEKSAKALYAVLFYGAFLLSALLLWPFLYDLANAVGATVSGSPMRAVAEILRMMPLFLLAAACANIGVTALSLGRTDGVSLRAPRMHGLGIASAALGAACTLWVLVGWIVGEYGRFVEGYVSSLFPLDMLFGGILLVLFGRYALIYAKKAECEKKEKDKEDVPQVKDAVLFRIGRTAEYLLAAVGFGAVCLGVFTLDFRHGGVFFNVMLLLCYASPVFMLAAYRYVTTELKPEERKKAQRQFSLLFLALNLLLLGLYLLAVSLQNEAPNRNAQSILPIEITASFNAFLFLYPVANLVPPLVSLIRKKK